MPAGPKRDLRRRRIDVASRAAATVMPGSRGVALASIEHGLDAQCRDRDRGAGLAAQYRSFLKPFDRREPARYGRPAVVPDSSETLNIDRDTESQFEALLVKQRIMPRTANWYYASCWVIGSHLTDTLTLSRGTLQRSPLVARPSRLPR